MPTFVGKFLDYTKDAESPTSFFKWAAYAGIASILRDRVFYNLGLKRIFPNIYVLLSTEVSSEHRKSTPLDIIGNLVAEINNTKLIRGRTSMQSVMIDELARSETQKKSGAILKGGSCLLCADELAAFIVEDPAAVKILTDIYDFRKEYSYGLRSTGGKILIENVCVTMLAASNEEYLKEVYDTKAIYGGLLARTFLIKPNEFRRSNSLLSVDVKKYEEGFKELTGILRAMTSINGTMIMDKDAEVEYDKWYTPLRESYRKTTNKTGVMGRIHTGVLKLSMILGIDNNGDRVIKKGDVELAISECMALLPNYDSYAMRAGKSNVAEVGAQFLMELHDSKNNFLGRRDFLFKHWTDVETEVFDQLIMTLDGAGIIQIVLDIEPGYRMTEKGRSMYESKNRAGKQDTKSTMSGVLDEKNTP